MALKPPLEGVRVLRGQDWKDEGEDGGEGHLGTVQASPSNGMAVVLWDIGQENTYRAGMEEKFDLRIFDIATVGIQHPNTKCWSCGEEEIVGILWRCQQCVGCDLCSVCYADDKHDLRHQFLRIVFPGTPGKLMKKRKISVRIRAMGLFPGAKVTRGKDWKWADQDGGAGSEGEVVEILNKSNKRGKRNLVKVRWPHGKCNVYRLAYDGHVDVTCTDVEAGSFYYRDHLPCFATSDFSTLKIKELPEESAKEKSADPKEPAKETTKKTPTASRESPKEAMKRKPTVSTEPDDTADTHTGVCGEDTPSVSSSTGIITTTVEEHSAPTTLTLKENSMPTAAVRAKCFAPDAATMENDSMPMSESEKTRAFSPVASTRAANNLAKEDPSSDLHTSEETDLAVSTVAGRSDCSPGLSPDICSRTTDHDKKVEPARDTSDVSADAVNDIKAAVNKADHTSSTSDVLAVVSAEQGFEQQPIHESVKSEPATAEFDGTSDDTDAAGVKSEPATAEFDGTSDDTDAAGVKSEPATAEFDGTSDDTDAAGVKSEPATAEFDGTSDDTDAAGVKSEPATAEFDGISDDTDAAGTHLSGCQLQEPRFTEEEMSSVQSSVDPGTVEAVENMNIDSSQEPQGDDLPIPCTSQQQDTSEVFPADNLHVTQKDGTDDDDSRVVSESVTKDGVHPPTVNSPGTSSIGVALKEHLDEAGQQRSATTHAYSLETPQATVVIEPTKADRQTDNIAGTLQTDSVTAGTEVPKCRVTESHSSTSSVTLDEVQPAVSSPHDEDEEDDDVSRQTVSASTDVYKQSTADHHVLTEWHADDINPMDLDSSAGTPGSSRVAEEASGGKEREDGKANHESAASESPEEEIHQLTSVGQPTTKESSEFAPCQEQSMRSKRSHEEMMESETRSEYLTLEKHSLSEMSEPTLEQTSSQDGFTGTVQSTGDDDCPGQFPEGRKPTSSSAQGEIATATTTRATWEASIHTPVEATSPPDTVSREPSSAVCEELATALPTPAETEQSESLQIFVDQDLGATATTTAAAAAATSEQFAAYKPDFTRDTTVPQSPHKVGAAAAPGEITNDAIVGRGDDSSFTDSSEFRVGDKAAIGVPKETLKELQAGYGGVTHTMLKKIGIEGVVTKVLPSGIVGLKLSNVIFRVNPAALIKIYPHKVGDTVRIREDLYLLRVLNESLRWSSSMDQTVGKVGEVTRVDDDGNLHVSFGSRKHIYSPACCLPAPGYCVDSLPDRGTGDTSLRDRLAGLISTSTTHNRNGGGGGGRRIRLRDLAQMSSLSDLSSLTDQLSQLTGGGGMLGLLDERTKEGELQKAALEGDAVKVKELCRADPALVHTVHNGLTPLMLASKQGKRKVVLALLDLGADVNATGMKEQTALIAALDEKEEEMALLLLENGANVNQRNGKERTPLHSAVYNRMNEAAQLILHMGGDINAQDKYGDTPLHDSVARQNAVMVDLLLQQDGIIVNLINKKGYTPLQLACRLENSETVGLLLAMGTSDVNYLREQDMAALHTCVKENFLDGVRLLITVGNADVNLPSGRHRLTALHLACLTAATSIVETLLELGANVNVQEHNGNTPLHLAMGGNDGNIDSLEKRERDVQTRIQLSCLLIIHGAFVDAENNSGRPPTTFGHNEVQLHVRQFIEQNPELVRRKASRRGGGQHFKPAIQTSGLVQSTFMTSPKNVSMPCSLCQRQSDVTLKPCGHRCVCRTCADDVQFCPVCICELTGKEFGGSPPVPRQQDSERDPERTRTSSQPRSCSPNRDDPDTPAAPGTQARAVPATREAASKLPQEQELFCDPSQPRQSLNNRSIHAREQETVSRPSQPRQSATNPLNHQESSSFKVSPRDLTASRQYQERCSQSTTVHPVTRGRDGELQPAADLELDEVSSLFTSTFYPSDDDNSRTERKPQTAAPSEIASPASVAGSSDACQPARTSSSQSSGQKESFSSVSALSADKASSFIPQSEKATSVMSSFLGDTHEEGSTSDGNLLRVAVCRQFPTESCSAVSDTSATGRDIPNDTADAKLLPEELSEYFADEKSCHDESAKDNRSLMMNSTTTVDPSGYASEPLDSEDEGFRLPNLPSMPAGGMGDWMVMGPGGPLNLTNPNMPAADPPASSGDPRFNPWLSMNEERESGLADSLTEDRRENRSRIGFKKTDGGHSSQVMSRELGRSKTRDSLFGNEVSLNPTQFNVRSHDSPEVTRTPEERKNASQLISEKHTAIFEGQKVNTPLAQAETTGPVQHGHREATEKWTHTTDPFSSSTVTPDERSTTLIPEGKVCDQGRNQNKYGAIPKTTASWIEVKKEFEHDETEAKKDVQKDDASTATHATGPEPRAQYPSRRDNLISTQGVASTTTVHDRKLNKPNTAPITLTTPETATALITQNQPKEKKPDGSAFENVKSFIRTDNLSAIFGNTAVWRDQKPSITPSHADNSCGREAFSAVSGHGKKEAAADQTQIQELTTTKPGTHTMQRHLSVSDGDLKHTPDTGVQSTATRNISRQKSQSAETIKTTPYFDTKADSSQPETNPPNGANLRNATSKVGTDQGQRKTAPTSMAQTADDNTELREGDRVVIKVTEERLVELQLDFGGTTKGMFQCPGKTGTVTRLTSGVVSVKFNSLTYRFNPQALMRVHEHAVGDTVRVRSDLDFVKLLNKRVDFPPGMVETLGKVGTVTKVDEEGDLTVSFSQSSFRYSPASCLSAPGAIPNDVAARAEEDGAAENSGEERGSAEPLAFMQKLAKMVREGASVNQIMGSPGADSSAISRLFEAIKNDNLQLVRSMCQSDPSLVNGVHGDHQLTTLMYASWKGKVDIVRHLLDIGADVNGRLRHTDDNPMLESRFPLSAALETKQEEAAVLLLQRGADPNNLIAVGKRRPLHMAAIRNLVQVTQVLLQMGVDVNARDSDGDSPLLSALQVDKRAVADILLQVDLVDINIVNNKGQTALHAACARTNLNAVEQILTRDRSHVNTRMKGGYAPLHLAAEKDGADIIRLLALIGEADVNIEVGGQGQHAGDTPLHRACLRGYFSCVEALLDFGAQVNVENKEKDTPLHYAVADRIHANQMDQGSAIQFPEERVRIVCTLISNGAFVDAEDDKRRTFMRYGSPEIKAAVQDFMDRNQHLVCKKGRSSGGSIYSAYGTKPASVPRGVSLPCAVCSTNMSDVTLLPCAHKTACSTCADRLTICPLCQRRVDSTTTDDRKAALFEAIT